MATGVVTVAIAGVAVAIFAIAPRPASGDGAGRIAAEAVSVAKHSGSLADGEAFDGDIQILRNADDARLRDPATLPEDRETALRQMLLVNTNRFDAFALVDLHGNPIAATDATLGRPTGSAAYRQSLGSDSVSASDLVTDPDGAVTLDYAAPVRDERGRTQAILVGRTTPARLWATTLHATIDGGRNVIVAGDGRPVAGVGDTAAAATAGLIAGDGPHSHTIAGVPSICALVPIGRDTHLDHGLSVASCLPSSLIATAASFPALQFAINAVAVALVAFSAALLLLAWLLGERARPEPKTEAPSGLKAIEARLLAQREGPGPR